MSIESVVINRGPAGPTGPRGPGVEIDESVTVDYPTTGTLRFRVTDPSGSVYSLSLPMALDASVDAPVLEDLEAYRTSSTTFVGVPWGSATWAEPGLGTLAQVVDIWLPSGTAPTDGWPMVVHFHANGGTRVINSGSSLDTWLVQPALAAGYAVASVEFRHPVVQAAIGAPHTDTGLAIQYLRSLHLALNLDRSKFHALARSRGSLALWQSLQSDMADAEATTYAGRQSSLLKSLWTVQAQIFYSTTAFANAYIVAGDRAAVITANPDNAAWRNAYDAVSSASTLPNVAMTHELPWYGVQVSKATMDADGSQIHFPDAGRLMRDAYIARGFGERLAAWDNEPSAGSNEEQLGDSVRWFRYIDEGMNAVEALAMARAARRNAQAHYIPTNLGGVYVEASPLGGVPVTGGPVGAVAPSQLGIANRLLSSPSGYAAAQLVSANKPFLSSFPNGKPALLFDSTDRLAVGMPSAAGTPSVIGWTNTGEVTTLSSATTSNYVIGQAAYDGKKLGLLIGRDGSHSTNDLKIYRRFANWLTGVTY